MPQPNDIPTNRGYDTIGSPKTDRTARNLDPKIGAFLDTLTPFDATTTQPRILDAIRDEPALLAETIIVLAERQVAHSGIVLAHILTVSEVAQFDSVMSHLLDSPNLSQGTAALIGGELLFISTFPEHRSGPLATFRTLLQSQAVSDETRRSLVAEILNDPTRFKDLAINCADGTYGQNVQRNVVEALQARVPRSLPMIIELWEHIGRQGKIGIIDSVAKAERPKLLGFTEQLTQLLAKEEGAPARKLWDLVADQVTGDPILRDVAIAHPHESIRIAARLACNYAITDRDIELAEAALARIDRGLNPRGNDLTISEAAKVLAAAGPHAALHIQRLLAGSCYRIGAELVKPVENLISKKHPLAIDCGIKILGKSLRETSHGHEFLLLAANSNIITDLLKCGAPTLEKCEALLKSAEATDRVGAAKILAASNHWSDTVLHLMERDTCAEVRQSAIEYCRSNKSPELHRVLVDSLGDPNIGVRHDALCRIDSIPELRRKCLGYLLWIKDFDPGETDRYGNGFINRRQASISVNAETRGIIARWRHRKVDPIKPPERQIGPEES